MVQMAHCAVGLIYEINGKVNSIREYYRCDRHVHNGQVRGARKLRWLEEKTAVLRGSLKPGNAPRGR